MPRSGRPRRPSANIQNQWVPLPVLPPHPKTGWTLGPCENVSPTRVTSSIKPKPNSQENLSDRVLWFCTMKTTAYLSFSRYTSPLNMFLQTALPLHPSLPLQPTPQPRALGLPSSRPQSLGYHWLRGHPRQWKGPPQSRGS